MKTAELFEARSKKIPPPDWAKEELQWFKNIIGHYGFKPIVSKEPVLMSGRWVFGGEIKMVDADSMLTPEQRMKGLQKTVAKHLHEKLQHGFEPVVFSVRRRYIDLPYFDYDPHYLWDMSSTRIEDIVKERLFLNWGSDGKYYNFFYYGMTEPKAEAPKEEPKPRVLRVVKAAK